MVQEFLLHGKRTEMLGLSAIDGGEYVGWNCDDGLYWIDFNHRKTVLDDGLEVYVIEMVWTPDTNWCDEEYFTMECKFSNCLLEYPIPNNKHLLFSK